MQRLVQSYMTEHYSYEQRQRWNCDRCKTQFESKFHLEIHNCEGISKYKGKPRLRLQNLHDELILSIASHLCQIDLVSFIDALPKLRIIHGLKKIWLDKYPSRKLSKDKLDHQYYCLESYEDKMDSYNAMDGRGLFLVSLHKSVHRYAIHQIIIRASKRVKDSYKTRACQHCSVCKQFCLFRKRRFQVERKINECEQRFNCCGSSWSNRMSKV